MSQRYERINANDEATTPIDSPSRSPPPSFRSRASSITPHHTYSERDRLVSDADRTLADTFDSPSDDDSDDEHTPRLDDRQRVMSGRPSDRRSSGDNSPIGLDGRPAVERRVTQLPVFAPPTSGRTYGGGNGGHDGVFANLSAKPARAGEADDLDEKPPTYEQAAADATPPYWETTILTPGSSGSPDDVFIDGLPVGSFFSFVWNGMISMSFQLVGFLLTYLLHTSHAAKHGSKAGLGITMIQFGFGMKRSNAPASDGADSSPGGAQGNTIAPDSDGFIPPPPDPNAHDFDPSTAASGAAFVADASSGAAGAMASGMKASDWFAYALMIVGWFVLIRAISEYFKARRHEQLVLQSPGRGLGVPVVAEGEGSERVV